MALEFKTYTRKPFSVEAVEVTAENIDEIAKLIGNVEVRKDGSKFIVVDSKKMPNIDRVNVGWWVTRSGNFMRAYKPWRFTERFQQKEE